MQEFWFPRASLQSIRRTKKRFPALQRRPNIALYYLNDVDIATSTDILAEYQLRSIRPASIRESRVIPVNR